MAAAAVAVAAAAVAKDDAGTNGAGKDDLFAREKLGSTATELGKKGDAILGALLDGRYRIKTRLGQGGVGAVYGGEHVETLRPVAVKMLHAVFAGSDEFHKRFEREARAASKLTHPSCVSVLDYGRVERVEPVSAGAKLLGTPYLVMEFVRGTPLADRVGTPLPPAEAIVIARGVLSALKHAHGLGIVHRDIKPANIMLVEDGGTGLLVKLLDFGLAKMADSDSAGEAPLTQAGMVFGTPGYLSPEQAAGKKVDARSDLYAVGVILFEMVCHRRLFDREDPLDFVRDHLNTPPRNPRSLNPQCSTALAELILKLLAKTPEARFQTAQELAEALAHVPEATGHTGPVLWRALVDKTMAQARGPGPLGRPWWQWGAAGAGAFVLVVVVASALHKPPAPHVAPPPAPKPAPSVSQALPLPQAAVRHLELADGYRRKLWCSDALEELERAAREDARAARLPETTQIAIGCLTPKTRDKAVRFLVERVCPEARRAVEEAQASDPNPEVRRGAERVLERLR